MRYGTDFEDLPSIVECNEVSCDCDNHYETFTEAKKAVCKKIRADVDEVRGLLKCWRVMRKATWEKDYK